jgi:hypothetical protein
MRGILVKEWLIASDNKIAARCGREKMCNVYRTRTARLTNKDVTSCCRFTSRVGLRLGASVRKSREAQRDGS